MNFGSFIRSGRQFEDLVRRLFLEEGTSPDSDLYCFREVGADLRGDRGIDGFLPNGTVFQVYYSLGIAKKPMDVREQDKVRDTCRKIAANREEVERIIGGSVRRIAFVLARKPDVNLIRYCNETVKEKLPGCDATIWGEARLSNLVAKHAEAVRDLLPPELTRRLPKLRLTLSAAGHSGDKVAVYVGGEIAGPESSENVSVCFLNQRDPWLDRYGRFLDRQDPRFKEATGGLHFRRDSIRRHRLWADCFFRLFAYHVAMTRCPRISFELSNDGEAYARQVKAQLHVPRDLGLILALDVPHRPPRVPHPREASAQEFAAAAEAVPADEDGRDLSDDGGWSYPTLDLPTCERRPRTLHGIELSPDGTTLTWSVGDAVGHLVHQGTPVKLECAVKPPYEDRDYPIEYMIHYEEGREPTKDTLVLAAKPLDDQAAMELAWQQMKTADDERVE